MANPAPGYLKRPEHRVDLHPDGSRVRVMFAGEAIADSTATVRCEETGHGPVHYFPEKDVRLNLLHPTAHQTHCPFKGDASYWTIEVGSGAAARRAENAVWGYRTPFDEAGGLGGYYAFYSTRVDSIDVT